jgi:hypothetical protein
MLRHMPLQRVVSQKGAQGTAYEIDKDKTSKVATKTGSRVYY